MLAFLSGVYAGSALAAFAMLIVGIYARRARNSLYFTLMSLMIFIRNLGFLFEITAESLSSALLATKIQYFGAPFIAPFFMLFVLEYCEVKIRRRNALSMFIIPAAACLLVTALPIDIYYGSVEFINGAYLPHIVVEGSAFYSIFNAYNGLLSVASDCVLLYFFMRRDRTFKRQSLTVVIASILPLVSTVLLVFGGGWSEDIDLMPLSLGVTCLLIGYSFWRFEFYKASPVAREQTIEAMQDGFVLLDAKGALQDANIAAKRILPALQKVSLGTKLSEIPELAWLAKKESERGDDFEASFPGGEHKHYQLSETQVRLAGRNVGRCINIFDITEQTALQEKLSAALEEAEIANKAKSSFLANMSHEIRTPMNAILGITEILVQDAALPDNIMEGLSKIHSSGGLLLGIINDVLDLSKIEAGKLDITPAPYEIASLVNDSVQLNMMRIGSRPIEFILEIDEKIPAQLVGDELRIKQIINNLLSNAFKYTDSGKVTLRVGFERMSQTAVEAGDDRIDLQHNIKLILEVTDTGHGMTEAQVATLFDEYTRFELESSRIIEGTGLGMAITQRLLYLMHGEIRVDSAVGAGTKFCVFLPQSALSENELGADVAESLRSFRMSLMKNRKRSSIVREPMPYGRVLVVDDVETNIYVALGLFKLYGLKTDSAISGAQALAKVEAGNVYDIIFMDHMMPGMDGIEATARLRALGYAAPIVALTANAVAKQADVFLQSGFDDFIAKPIDIRQLNAVLNRLIRDKQTPETLEKARAQAQSAKAGADEKAGKNSKYGENASSDENDALLELDPMLLSSFVRDAKKAVAVFDGYLNAEANADAENLRQFTIAVHGMKSALANIGESELSETAKLLETAGKASDGEYIRQNLYDFLERLRSLIEKISNKLVPENVEENTSDSETDAPENAAFLREKLQALQEMCDDYDRKGATAILAEIAQKRLTPETRDAIERMTEAVLHSEFEEAAEIASEFVR